jgi:hypothetical protein
MFGGLIRDMVDILRTGKKIALAENSYFSVVRDHAEQKIYREEWNMSNQNNKPAYLRAFPSIYGWKRPPAGEFS